MKALRKTTAIALATIWILLLARLCEAKLPPFLAPKPKFLRESNFDCKPGRRNPVLVLHGLTANFHNDLAGLEKWLQKKGYCTFALTYGALPGLANLVGMKSLAVSTKEVGRFVRKIRAETGAKKVDLVGHSEGALQALYTAKFGGVTSSLKHIIAIAPPTHGITFYGIYFLFPERLRSVGIKLITKVCAACTDMLYNSATVRRLNEGGIVQRGHNVTIIASHFDEGVTPPAAASFVKEKGAHNEFVQDYCPDDRTGHFGEATDTNIYNLVLNSLEDKICRNFTCGKGGGVI